MSNEISRREMLSMTAAGAVASVSWVYRIDSQGKIVKQVVESAEEWKPQTLTSKEADQLSVLCETILPETDTPGAKTARVHEYIDLALSMESEDNKNRMRDGLKWLDKQCKKTQKKSIVKASTEQLIDLLTPLSDEHDNHPDELKPGATILRNLKSRTIFAYFTSKEGRVEALGLPEFTKMTTFDGCTHQGNH